MSRSWSLALRVIYWAITRLQPLIRPWAERGELGNVVELIVVGRRTGRRRVVLLGLLQVDQRWYLGHPNGPVDWTRNLDVAGRANLVMAHQPSIEIQAELLPVGDERRRVIAATWHQHVFPGNALYWLARRHILAVGRYYRIEPHRDVVDAARSLDFRGGAIVAGDPVAMVLHDSLLVAIALSSPETADVTCWSGHDRRKGDGGPALTDQSRR